MENTNALKNKINENTARRISTSILKYHSEFDAKRFNLISNKLSSLELKGRVVLLTEALKKFLPIKYLDALEILVEVIEKEELKGFELWPFSEFIGKFGLEHMHESLNAMYVLTQKFTSEFAVRPFLLKDHQLVLDYFSKWALDENYHVRRWVSEGSRPLLPWGERLPHFVKDPTHTLKILEKLKYDKELYVRKSVANHLNDISKHHPSVVIQTIQTWEKTCEEEHLPKILWIKKQALRTLIKKGHPEAMKLMGANHDPKIKVSALKLDSVKLRVGDKLKFHFQVVSLSSRKQKILIDYILHFMKANGSLGPKVFKLKQVELGPYEMIKIEKTHQLKQITTMTFYSGKQNLSVQINGKVWKKADFKLKI